MLNERNNFMNKDRYSKNPTFRPEKRLNIVRNTCIRADKEYRYETSKEIFLIEPHDNDLYVQN